MKPKKKYWLHCYSQQRWGDDPCIDNEANTWSPGDFLLHLFKTHPDVKSVLHWSVQISSSEFRRLRKHAGYGS
jgi:hypothetical protein